MMLKNYNLIIITVCIITTHNFGQTHTDPLQFSSDSGGTGHYYSLLSREENSDDSCITWMHAHRYAALQRMYTPDGRELWGHLATIGSPEENLYLTRHYVHEWAHAWIGAFRYPEDTSSWQWITGEPWEYTNWWYDTSVGAFEPTNNDGEEQVQMLNFGDCFGCWFDYHVFFDNGEFAGPCWLTYGLIEFEQPFLLCNSIQTPRGDTLVYIRSERSVPLKITLTDIIGNPVSDSRFQPLLILETQSQPVQTVSRLPLKFGKNGDWHVILHGADLPQDKGMFLARVISPDTTLFRVNSKARFVIYNNITPQKTDDGVLDDGNFDKIGFSSEGIINPQNLSDVSKNSRVKISVYDLAGKLIMSWTTTRFQATRSAIETRLHSVKSVGVSKKYVCRVESIGSGSSVRPGFNKTFIITGKSRK